ncbi:MAG: hypothetical protein FJ126_04825 [Deltaproteobacteria bacterium]|nr:hypothetical protein [Deltaproteobacteria bacterium]
MTTGESPDKDYRWQAGVGLLLLAALLNNLGGTAADPDLWGYMAFGRLFWEEKQFPYHDVFAYVPTLAPWVYHEWLTGVVFYPVYQACGPAGLQLLKYVFGLGAAAFIFLTALRRGAHFWSAALVLWMTQLFANIGYSPVRAQVFTYFFFALSVYLLEQARLGGGFRRLWLLAFLQPFWCNLHGGFVAGLGLIGIYGLGEALSRRRSLPYFLTLGAAVLATLANPYGLEYWTYIIRAVSMPRPEITEWASLAAGFQRGIVSYPEVLYFTVITAFVILLGWWAKWRELSPLLALAVTLYLGLKHIRHQVFFLLLTAAYLPKLFTEYGQALKFSLGWKQLGGKIPAIGAAILGATLFIQFLGKSPWKLEVPSYSQPSSPLVHYPLGAMDYIRTQRLEGKLLLEFKWGEYAMWTLYPRCRVALDGRYETVYPDEICREYFDFIYARGEWRRFLERYPPDLVLLNPQSPAYPRFLTEPGWRLAYRDTGCALFVRQESLMAKP